jgi:hypothetical protein
MRTRTLLTLLAALAALAPGAARACGMPFEASIAHEQALLIVDGERQQLITSLDLRDAAPDAAVVLPVPGIPEQVDQPAGADALFPYLREATAPLVRTETRLRLGTRGDGSAGGAPGGVALLGAETIGGYDVARLAADDAGALQAWLDANGYSVPPAAAPILDDYVADGWSFVAVKLAQSAPNGSLAPLRVSYRSDRLVYPMRLGVHSEQHGSVDLYVLAANRVTAPTMTTRYAGPSALLDPAPSAELADLFASAPYLTWLSAPPPDPAAPPSDAALQAAPSDEPYREEIVRYDDIYIFDGALGVFLAIICLTGLTPLSIVIALALRRRIYAISPPPDKS